MNATTERAIEDVTALTTAVLIGADRHDTAVDEAFDVLLTEIATDPRRAAAALAQLAGSYAAALACFADRTGHDALGVLGTMRARLVADP